jgi:hypothetical protein
LVSRCTFLDDPGREVNKKKKAKISGVLLEYVYMNNKNVNERVRKTEIKKERGEKRRLLRLILFPMC